MISDKFFDLWISWKRHILINFGNFLQIFLLYLPFLFFEPCTTSAIQKLFTTSINAFLGGCKVITPFLENLIQPILDSHTSELNKNAVNTKYQWDFTFCYTFLLQLGKDWAKISPSILVLFYFRALILLLENFCINEQCKFNQHIHIMSSILKTIYVVWSNSNFYNTPTPK